MRWEADPAVLRELDLLPVGEISASTASVTEIHGRAKKRFSANVTFISIERWESQVSSVLELCEAPDDGGESKASSLPEEVVRFRDAWAALSNEHRFVSERGGASPSVAPHVISRRDNELRHEVMAMLKDPEQRARLRDNPPRDVLRLIQRGSIVFTTANAIELRNFLASFTDKSVGRYWPLVFKIDVFGPFPLLIKNEISLVDIPGFGDSDPGMLQRFNEGIQECDAIITLPVEDERRFNTPQIAHAFLGHHVRGKHSIATVVTRAANVLPTLRRALGLEDLQSAKERTSEEWTARLREHLSAPLVVNDDWLASRVAVNRLFFVDCKDPSYDGEFEALVATIRSDARQNLRAAADRFRRDIEDAALLLRDGLMDQQLLQDMRPLWQRARSALEPAALKAAQDEVARRLPLPAAPQEPPELSGGVRFAHYSQLACLFRREGAKDKIDLFPSLAQSALGSEQLHARAARIAAADKLLKERVLEALSGRELREGINPLMIRAVRIAREKIEKERAVDPDDVLDEFNSHAAKKLQERYLTAFSQTRIQTGRFFRQRMLEALGAWCEREAEVIRRLANGAVEEKERTLLTSSLRRTRDLVEQSEGRVSHFAHVPNTRDAANALRIFFGEPTVDDAPQAPRSRSVELPLEARLESFRLVLLSLHEKFPEDLREAEIISPLDDRLFRTRNSAGLLRLREEGFVYVMANKAFPDRQKIGITTGRAEDRAAALSTTGVPEKFLVKASARSRHARLAEMVAHNLLRSTRKNPRREFFAIDERNAVHVVNTVVHIINEQIERLFPEAARQP